MSNFDYQVGDLKVSGRILPTKPSDPSAGALYKDSKSGKVYIFDGRNWQRIKELDQTVEEDHVEAYDRAMGIL